MGRVVFDGVGVKVQTLVYVIQGGKVLVLERSADKKFLPGWVVAPGGKVEPGEGVMEAGAREFREETGLEAVGLRLRGSYTYMTMAEGNRAGVIYLLTAEGYEGDFRAEVEDGTLRWMSFAEVYAHPKVMEDHKVFLKEIFEGSNHVACIGSWDNGVGVEWADSMGYFEERAAA